MPINRVHLTAGDSVGWAIDEDLRLVRESLRGVCEITSLARAQAVHSCWWLNLLPYSRDDLRGKHVVCYVENPPFYYASLPEFLKARELVTTWVVRSREAAAQFSALGIESRYAPYTFDPKIFFPLAKDDPQVTALCEKWRIPTDRYLIANFHRDTEGADLQSPKLQKGPDLFLEIVANLHDGGAPIHVLLAGPRRFWLRQKLGERGVPFSYVGEETPGRDDLGVNTLPRSTLNQLYSLADLHLITSRWEGGPHSVLESAATRCKILSTAVGLANDVLAPECLFASVRRACDLVRADIAKGTLGRFVDAHYDRAQKHHTAPAQREHLAAIYESLEPMPASSPARSPMLRSISKFAARAQRFLQRSSPPKTLALLHRPAAGSPFDRFFVQLAEELRCRGCIVRDDLDNGAPDACVLGHLPIGDPLRKTASALTETPMLGFFDEAMLDRESALALHRELSACTLLPSLDAFIHLRRENRAPREALVLTPPLTPNAAPPELDEVCVVKENDSWAAGRIQQSLARGVPVLYPGNSAYRYLVWFGGLAYRDPQELAEKLAEVRADYAIYRRLAAPASLPALVDRLLRLIPICRELASHARP